MGKVSELKVVAFVPVKAGSDRIPNKNLAVVLM